MTKQPASPLDRVPWISRSVPAGERITREIRRHRIEWVSPGRTIAQSFRADGPVTVVNADIAGPPDVDPFTADVAFTLRLETAEGATVAELVTDGPQLLWDYFGRMLEVSPPAPPGDYVLVLEPTRHTIGWWTSDTVDMDEDNGVSPLAVRGSAYRDGVPEVGTRLIGVETVPAPNPIFRRVFQLGAPVREARLTASVLGAGVIHANGRRIGDGMLEPAVTDYDRTVLYRSWSIAHLLAPGENEIVIHAGRERYAARGGDIWGWNLAPWHREPVAAALLEITHEDGTTWSLVSDSTWQCAAGPVERELLFGGEDWVVRGGDVEWGAATVVAPPFGVLREAAHPAVTALAPKPPIVTENVDGTSVIYDFGEVMTGRIRCVVSGLAGAVISVTSGEQRARDGSVVCDNVLAAGHAQRDTLRLERDVERFVWEPQFSYRGFRWMQVDVAGEATATQVRAIPLYTPLDVVGEFHTDHEVSEWVDAALARTFRNNLHGIPTDTPIYEKNGWTADAHLAAEGLLHHYDLRAPFAKWMGDHRDAQRADGAIPHIVPTPGWGRDSDPAWSSSAVLIPWYMYQEYGDPGILEPCADMVRRFADHLLSRLEDGIWTDRTWGDWLAPGGFGVGPEGMAPIGTLTTVDALRHTALVLAALGHRDAATYDVAAARVGEAYHAVWFDHARGCYRVDGVSYRQSLNLLPLAFGVVPEPRVKAVQESLIADLEGRTGGHLDCGAVGMRHLLPVLSAAGRDDLALTVLDQRTRPGWGVWLEDGETTLLEAWDAEARSRNHYFLGSVASWIQQRVGGLKLTAPGWSRFEVNPVRDDRVQRGSIRHRTPHGTAGLDWRRGPGGWELEILVPKDALANVVVDGSDLALTGGTHHVRITEA